MKTIFFALFLLIFAGCKVFDTNYVDVARSFTEANVKRLFKLDTFSFAGTKHIEVKKAFRTDALVKVLGKRLAYKITGNGQARFENKLVETWVRWETVVDSTSIHYFRQAK